MRPNERIWGEISDRAVFIADSHYNEKNRQLERLLEILEAEDSDAPIFLMGDIFDLLIGGICDSFITNAPLLERISLLGTRRRIYWCEGNHDFNLSGRIANVCVISRENQPAKFTINGGGYVYMAHGDLGVGSSYEIYTKFIRNRLVLGILGFLNHISNGYIFRKICDSVSAKKLHVGVEFSKLLKARAEFYKGVNGAVFEGHFHTLGEAKMGDFSYFAIPSLACNESYFVVKSTKGLVSIQIKEFGCL